MRINTIGIPIQLPPRRTKHLMIPRLMIILTAIFTAASIALLQMGALAQSGKMYRIGLVSVGAPDSGILGPGMVQDFAKRGYAVDRNIVFEHRAAEGRPERLPGLVDESVADHVHLIITQKLSRGRRR